MSYVLAYLVVGVIVTALRFVAIAMVAKWIPAQRSVMLQHGFGVFVCSVPFWPIDLFISAFKLVKFIGWVCSALLTARRMRKGLAK
jgi:hypothetical protein